MIAAEPRNHPPVGQRTKRTWREWYESREKCITLGLNTVTALGTVCAAGALVLTFIQIQEAQEVLTANTQYQISKDSAELWDTIPNSLWQQLRTSAPLDVEAERQVLRVFSYVAAVQEQKQLVSDKFWKEFSANFCGFLKLPSVSDFWATNVASGKYQFNDDFVALGNQCRR